jgi:hypothetical protein
VLKHVVSTLDLITRPSNREGLKDGFGGLRAVLIFWGRNLRFFTRAAFNPNGESLQVGTDDVNQFIGGQRLFGGRLLFRVQDMKADMVLD